jgi:hypothetical protein
MQRMQFTCKSSLQLPDADVYCLSPEQIEAIPPHCLSIYITTALTSQMTQTLAAQLTSDTLIIDYRHEVPWETLLLHPKSELEQRVDTEWEHVQNFFTIRGITPSDLNNGQMQNVDAMDDALDVLLNVSQKFLEVANNFHHALELARPLKISKTVRLQYDSLALLAHRVQALTPSAFTQRFLETYNEDDTFFLYDVAKSHGAQSESLEEAVLRHRKAKRFRLANALILYRSNARRLRGF